MLVAAYLALLASLALPHTWALRFLGSTTLGKDPHTVNHLNGESFQQDSLVTFNGMTLSNMF